eukprot:5097217-Amphidinium_carterae.2
MSNESKKILLPESYVQGQAKPTGDMDTVEHPRSPRICTRQRNLLLVQSALSTAHTNGERPHAANLWAKRPVLVRPGLQNHSGLPPRLCATHWPPRHGLINAVRDPYPAFFIFTQLILSKHGYGAANSAVTDANAQTLDVQHVYLLLLSLQLRSCRSSGNPSYPIPQTQGVPASAVRLRD